MLKRLLVAVGTVLVLSSARADIVNMLIPGPWSVDFAQHSNGDWYFIDAARAQKSFHWTPCSFAVERGWPQESPRKERRNGSLLVPVDSEDDDEYETEDGL